MGLLDCLHITLPFTIGILATLFGPLSYGVYKYGVKATSGYLISMPTRIAGYIFMAYSSKITKVFAFTTALGGTIKAAATSVATQTGWMNILTTFVHEVYRETLSATGLMAQGFQNLTQFLTTEGVCSQLVQLNLVATGIFNLWRGAAIIIVVLTGWGFYRNRGRKTEVDLDEKILLITALFSLTALINSKTGDGVSIFQVLESGTEFFETLAQQIPGSGAGNTTVNSSINTSLNSTSS